MNYAIAGFALTLILGTLAAPLVHMPLFAARAGVRWLRAGMLTGDWSMYNGAA